LKCAQKFAANCHTEQGKKVADFFVEVVEVLQDYHKLTLLLDEWRKGLRLRHDVLIKQNPRISGFSACYIAIVGILNNFHLVKLGRSDDIGTRMGKLKNTFGECFLYDVIVVRNGLDLENKLKADPFLQKHHLEKEDLPDALKSQTELYRADDFPLVDRFGTAIRSLTKELATAQEAEWIHNERMKELDIEYLRLLKDLGVPPTDVKEILARVANRLPSAATSTERCGSVSVTDTLGGQSPVTERQPPPSLQEDTNNAQTAAAAQDAEDVPREASTAAAARPTTAPASAPVQTPSTDTTHFTRADRTAR